MSKDPAAFSPSSIGSSEWSGVARYQSNDPTHSPKVTSSNSRNNNHTNLFTPPPSSSGTSLNGSFTNGMNRRPQASAGNPSPPNSVARSSNGTTLSTESSRRKASLMEESLAQHYHVLKKYLAQSLSDEKGNPKPNRARDKLLRLSPVQFQELSTDVYDELLRRQNNAEQKPTEVPEFLVPKENFHPKRNQARQKLSTLPHTRFRDLATDVFYELERRFPQFTGADIDRRGSPTSSVRGPPSRTGTPNGARPSSREQGPRKKHVPRQASLGGQVFAGLGIPGIGAQDDLYSRPTAKSSQSNTIIPNKSTLVEDDDDQTGPEDNDSNYGPGIRNRTDIGSTKTSSEQDKRMITDYQAQIVDLQGKVSDLELRVRDKNIELEKVYISRNDAENAGNAERAQSAKLRVDLEGKLASALNLNKDLQSELDKIKVYQTEKEEALRRQLDEATRHTADDSEWKLRHDQLDRDHRDMQRELREQQQVTDEVKQEASAFLVEMKAISARHDQNCEREENLIRQIHILEDELKEWKNRYVRTKAQLRTVRTGSMGLLLELPTAGCFAKDGEYTRPDGLIKDFHVAKFHVAIDEVLRAARVGEYRVIMDCMKMVVLSIRHIYQDVGNPAPDAVSDASAQQRAKLRSKVSATANNFITASKNFATSQGISPVSLLDAAASHLASAVVELIQIVKIRPTPPTELEDDEEDESLSAGSPGLLSVSDGRPSIADSIYSPPKHGLQFSPAPSDQNRAFDKARELPLENGIFKGKPSASVSKRDLGMTVSDREIEELKLFLEDQTEALVHSIQSLVTSIRTVDEPEIIRDRVGSIIQIVGHVVKESQHVIDTTGDAALRDEIEPTIKTLAECKVKLLAADNQGRGIQEHSEWKEFANTLPPVAFEIARETKELMQGINRILDDGAEDDDFR